MWAASVAKLTDSRIAYDAARRMIETALADAADRLDFNQPKTLAMTKLPDKIAELAKLRSLDLRNTHVTSLSPLATMTWMTRLWLSNTRVSDLSPIAAMTGMTRLTLSNTRVSDLSPLVSMTGMTGLWLDNTPVLDLRVLRELRKLVDDPGLNGLTFKNTAATRADPRIAEISEIEDAAERARVLFEYLEGWEVPGGEWSAITDPVSETETLDLPPQAPAPLETEVRDNVLSVSIPRKPPLPAGQTDDRARKGWQVLQSFREDFVGSLNIANYRPLASAIAAFDRATGASYEEMNEIGVGMSGLRLAALSDDAEFMATLPEGAGTELGSIASAITTFVNRFPEWIAYLNDPAETVPVAALVQEQIATFLEIEKSLAAAPDVAKNVLAEYRDEVELVRNSPSSEVLARGLLASTRDLLRTLSENALIGIRMCVNQVKEDIEPGVIWTKARAIHEAREFSKIAPTEIRKKAMWFVLSVTGDIIFLKGGLMLSLAAKFPAQLGWIEKVLHFIGVI